MKLIIAIIHKEDSKKLTRKLLKENFQLTRLESTGGFLNKKNTTILIGLKKSEVDKALSIIKEVCKARTEYIDTTFLDSDADKLLVASEATKIKVGGANIFVIDVEKFEKI